jgi:BlaI family transcriptional regulator, penicillinase repressor
MTERRSSPARVRPPLTDLEHDVMRVVWTSGDCSVEAVHTVIARDRQVKETTVRTLLRRLEQKGYLTHRVDRRSYIYRAAEPPRSLAARAVRQIIDRLCHGSVEELVSGMVDAEVLTNADLRRLEAFVRNRRQGAQ